MNLCKFVLMETNLHKSWLYHFLTGGNFGQLLNPYGSAPSHVIYLIGLLQGMNQLMFVKHVQWCLAHRYVLIKVAVWWVD